MVRASICCSACFGVIATVVALLLFGPLVSAAPQALPTSPDGGACALLTPGEIAQTTGFKVGDGKAGHALPGVQGKCIWDGPGVAEEVIVVLSDSRHAEITFAAVRGSGGTDVPGIGSKAVGNKNPSVVGGYVVLVQDAKGGFAVSTGRGGTRDNTIALAKIVESRR